MTDTIDYRFSYWGPFVLEAKIEKEFADILLEKGKESREKNLDSRKDLAGAIEHEYYYEDVDDLFFSKMKPYINVYQRSSNYRLQFKNDLGFICNYFFKFI